MKGKVWFLYRLFARILPLHSLFYSLLVLELYSYTRNSTETRITEATVARYGMVK